MEEKVINVFNDLNIEYELIHHKNIFKSTDRENENIDFKGAICCKNLLVKEQSGENKGKLYLIALAIDKRADLKAVSNRLNISRLTFASEVELIENLGIKSGNASILNIIEKPETLVSFIIDEELLNFNKVAFHPNDNSMSIIFEPKSIKDIMEHFGASYQFLNF